MAERRLDEAVQAQQAALAADPRYARAHWALAQLARARGDEGAAREHLRAYVKLAPAPTRPGEPGRSWPRSDDLRGNCIPAASRGGCAQEEPVMESAPRLRIAFAGAFAARLEASVRARLSVPCDVDRRRRARHRLAAR